MTKTKKIIIYICIFALLNFFTVSCKVPEPITLMDTNQIDSITLKVKKAPESWPLSDQTQSFEKRVAGDIEGYVLLCSLIDSFERDYFEHRKERLPLLSKKNTSSSPDQLELILDTKMSQGNNDSTSYSLWLDTTHQEAYITNGFHSYSLEEEQVAKLLGSSILPLDENIDGFMKKNLIKIQLHQDDIQLPLDGSIEFRKTIYAHRNHSIKEVYRNYTNTELTTHTPLRLDLTGLGPLSPEDISLAFTPLAPLSSDQYVQANKSTQKASFSWSKQVDSVPNPLIYNQELDLAYLDIDLPFPDGHYRVDIDLELASPDKEKESYVGILMTSVITLKTQPVFTLNQTNYRPGDLIVISGHHLNDSDHISIDTNIYSQGAKFHADGSNHYLLLPLMSKTSPGNYFVKLIDDSGKLIENLTIPVVEKEFATQYLETSSSTESLRNEAAYDQLNEAFARGRDNLNPSKLWTGPFIRPVEGGRISTEYGETRYTNDNVVASRHSGIDFALPTGTPVYASQSGIVTLAEELIITGNTLFIDHGFGLISQYYHLDKIYVESGQKVKVGDLVAEIGTTGYSTGPHLHFSIYYSGVYINPWNFFDNEPF